jgi:uncharacterized protein (TIGR00661 family)
MNQSRPVILVAPLNWGIGHATRCIPLINELMQQGCEVIICGNGDSHEVLKQEFPELQHFRLPDYTIRYSDKPFWFSARMLFHLPRFIISIWRDMAATQPIVRTTKPDLLISDNRYGFRSKAVFSVILTHQVLPVLPGSFRFSARLFRKAMFTLLKKFNEVWVPDFEHEHNLSGMLSHHTGFKGNLKYCGPLSRFHQGNDKQQSHQYDLLAIISGPEPHRSLFEKYCIRLAETTTKRICIVAGKPGNKMPYKKENLTYFSHLDTEELLNVINQSGIVISRAGYSSIMDMVALNKKALLVPTPGQTEQIYLADFHSGKGLFLKFNPDTDDLDQCIQDLKEQNIEQEKPEPDHYLLRELTRNTLLKLIR